MKANNIDTFSVSRLPVTHMQLQVQQADVQLQMSNDLVQVLIKVGNRVYLCIDAVLWRVCSSTSQQAELQRHFQQTKHTSKRAVQKKGLHRSI